MSRRFHNFNNRKQFDNRKNSFSIKWSIIWVIIHFASLFLLIFGIQRLNLNNSLVILLLTGFGVTIISRAVRIFTLKKRFVVDKWFFFWSLINTFMIWLTLLLINILQITNYLLSLLFMSIGLVIVAYFVKKLRIRRTAMIISSIILIVILFFFNSNSSNIIDINTQVIETQTSSVKSNNLLSNIKDSINKLFSSISLDTCPQLPMVLVKSGQGIVYGRGDEELREECPTYSAEYGSDIPCVFYGEYHPVNSVSKLTGGIWVSPSAHLICRDAKYEGENRNYLYCDLGARYRDPISFMNNIFSGTDDTIPYIVKRPKEQGEIIEKQELVRKSFMNIYTKEGTFVKTVCGPDPDEVQRQEYEKTKKEFKDSMGRFMREIDDWFDFG